MEIFQSIEPRVMEMTKKSKELAFLTRDQIFEFLAELVCLSDEINNLIRDLDIKTLKAENDAVAMTTQNKMSASMASLTIKQASKQYKPERDWLNKQDGLLRDMRIAALAAQRGAE